MKVLPGYTQTKFQDCRGADESRMTGDDVNVSLALEKVRVGIDDQTAIGTELKLQV